MEHQAEYLRQGGMPSDMSMDEHMRMMERRHLATLWCHYANTMLGLWLITAPWVLGGAGTAAAIGSVIAGLLVVALSLPRGPVRNRYAGWNRYIV
jgi:hypothetical protein